MQKKNRIPFVPLALWLSGIVAGMAPVPAQALGFVSGTPSAVLGRPLDFRAVVRPDAGAPLEAECVRAGVVVGERVLPAQGVGIVVTAGPDDTAVVRVRTLTRIDEPIVTVEVEIGCLQRVSRRFTVFADPPTVDVPAAPELLADAAALSSAPGAIATTPAAPPPAARARSVDAAPAQGVDAPAAPAERPRPRPRPRPRSDAAPATAPSAVPRLRLDAAPPPVAAPAPAPVAAGEAAISPDTLALVDQANEAVQAAIAAASASQSRIAALESSVRELGAAAAEQRALIEQLRARAVEAESGSRWLWPLLLSAALLAAVSLWLWVRLRELEREQRRAWLAAAQAGRSSAGGAAGVAPGAAPGAAARRGDAPSPSQVPLLVDRGPRPRTSSVGTIGAGLAPVHQPTPSEYPDSPPTQPPAWQDAAVMHTQPLIGVPTPRVVELPRDVSAEELIDLEQQAEFFVVLGQDEAAIDLLVAHLRDSGGASPLPYLKLLDIYRRRGDREAYDRTRDRFNQRFNAHAPAWEAAGAEGRALEDYAPVVRLLQRSWPQPLDAMADLEALLFRRDDGELFDPPAYRELLLLYAVARDLLDSEPGGSQGVDVLLPLNDEPGFLQTSPRAYYGDETRPLDVQPTAPLDLDLGQPPADDPRLR